jgi:hypothetical protein
MASRSLTVRSIDPTHGVDTFAASTLAWIPLAADAGDAA